MKTPALPPGLALAPAPTPARYMAARTLRAASAALARLAQRLQASESLPVQAEPMLEFYAEAGAPEGALYVDGQLVGVLEGVTRL